MSRRILFFIAAACLVLPSAAMAQSAVKLTRVQAEKACASMGLNPSEAPFTYCVMSLRQAAAQPAGQMTSIRRACAGMGLAPGSQQYVSCVGNLNMTTDDANRVGTD